MQSTRTYHSMSWTFFQRSRTVRRFLKFSAYEKENTCKPHGPCTKSHGPSQWSWTHYTRSWKKRKKKSWFCDFFGEIKQEIYTIQTALALIVMDLLKVPRNICANGAKNIWNPQETFILCHGPSSKIPDLVQIVEIFRLWNKEILANLLTDLAMNDMDLFKYPGP